MKERSEVCTPRWFEDQVKELFEHNPNYQIEVLQEEQLAALGLHMFAAVGQGSFCSNTSRCTNQ